MVVTVPSPNGTLATISQTLPLLCKQLQALGNQVPRLVSAAPYTIPPGIRVQRGEPLENACHLEACR